MDLDPLGNAATRVPRKVKFAPKVPPRRPQKPVLPKVEKVEEADADEAKAQELLRRFNESSARAKVKNEKKPQARVAFTSGGSASMQSYGTPKGGIGINKSSEGGRATGPGSLEMKEYKEPWDYYTYYPVTLPLRRPYEGSPDLLDEEEFGEASQSMSYDEKSVNPAVELGIMEENLEASMFFLQMPSTVPLTKQSSANVEDPEMVNSSKPLKGGAGSSVKACGLDKLPAGLIGKMLVYKSGAVKLKLGDTLYDVSPGQASVFAQDVVAINVEEKTCCVVGELNKRVIITPDIDFITENTHEL